MNYKEEVEYIKTLLIEDFDITGIDVESIIKNRQNKVGGYDVGKVLRDIYTTIMYSKEKELC